MVWNQKFLYKPFNKFEVMAITKKDNDDAKQAHRKISNMSIIVIIRKISFIYKYG